MVSLLMIAGLPSGSARPSGAALIFLATPALSGIKFWGMLSCGFTLTAAQIAPFKGKMKTS